MGLFHGTIFLINYCVLGKKESVLVLRSWDDTVICIVVTEKTLKYEKRKTFTETRFGNVKIKYFVKILFFS